MNRLSSFFFFLLLLGATVATVMIFLPFFAPLLLAIAASVVIHPLYEDVRRVIGRGKIRNTLAAFITVLFVIVVILVPAFFLFESIYGEVQNLYSLLIDEANRSSVINSLNSAWISLSNVALGLLPSHSFDSFNITESLKGGLEWVFSNLDVVVSSLAKVAGYILIFVLALFYCLRDGISLRKLVLSWSPALSKNEAYISETFRRAIRSVFAGTLVVALIEGVSTGLAFWVFGIPAPALWGTVAAVAALVPAFGVTLMILPGAAYLVLSGHGLYAIGLIIWGYTAIILVDHTLGPILINRGLHIHPFLVLLSVLGGLLLFGIIGFVMGPLILVFLFTLLEIYKNSFGESGGRATN